MKIIQSFWTLPMLKGRKTVVENRFSGGWLHPKYHLMSWAYSCLRLRSYYDQVELVTDKTGKSLLIDQLQLPYTRVSIVLDNLNTYDPEWWAVGKLYTFGIQDQPFIHVDGDVFIWERFPERIEQAQLIAQNLEHDYPFYKMILHSLTERKCHIPGAIADNAAITTALHAYNAGIIGGNAIGFFKEYAQEAISFIGKNPQIPGNLSSGMVNAFYEQHLYYCMAKQKGFPVECYTSVIDNSLLDIQMKSLLQFQKAPARCKYIHLFGEDVKKDQAICSELASRLNREYPEYFERLLDMFFQYDDKKVINR